MQQIESQAIRDGSSESEFMEEAGCGASLIVHDFIEQNKMDKHVILLCGKGNNAGDAYVAGIYLLRLDYYVIAYQLFPLEESSPLCKQSYGRFVNEGGVVQEVSDLKDLTFPANSVLVDGIFGTGFHGVASDPIAKVIRDANESRLPIFSIDIPSGLNGETGEASEDTIVATKTAFLGLPKTGFFLREGWNHVGSLCYVDFGLKKEYIAASKADLILLSPEIMKPLMPPIVRNRNKYQAGYVIGLAGSPSMPGAAQLASLAALRGGSGIVRLLYPKGMQDIHASMPYELLASPYLYQDSKSIVDQMNHASAVFVGPGLGMSEETQALVSKVLPDIEVPCVIDADALSIFAEKNYALPKNTILTPHLGELKRMMHITSKVEISMEFLFRCQAFANDKNATLVLKGGPTFIFHPNEPIAVNGRGDPGMATAGSGDVLTGLIAALLAQGLSTKQAAYLGVYLHSIAGEFAAQDYTSYCFIASDIIQLFPEVFNPQNW